MENKDKPAYPLEYPVSVYSEDKLKDYGMSKRELFAMAAMQGLLTSIYSNIPMYQLQCEDWRKMYGPDIKLGDAIAKNSIELADCILKQLES